MEKLISWLFILSHPTFWLMNQPFNREWDKELNDLMDRNKFMNIDYYYAEIGHERIWIQNYPYNAFVFKKKNFSPFDNKSDEVRPSRWTIYKARRKLINDWGTRENKEILS